MDEARTIIGKLNLQPHPEGGWYRETWREAAPDGGRDRATAILFLLEAGQRSHWHRVDAAELWVFNAGGPLRLLGADGEDGEIALPEVTLGADMAAGAVVQHLFPAGRWQAAEPLADWTLVTCVVVPGFDFAGFELAAPDWLPAALR